jgi:hypothetical protein
MHVIRTDDAWSIWSRYGMTRRPDGWSNGQMSVRMGWHDRPDG